MIGNVAVLAAAEIDRSLPFIHAIQRPHIPITFRYLRDQLSVGAVVINLLPAIAAAQPKKRTILQPTQSFVDSFDPGFAGFAKQVRRLAVTWIRSVQIERSLFAILRLKPNFLAVGKPADPHDQ